MGEDDKNQKDTKSEIDDALEAADGRDPLEVRAMWRRCGRSLTVTDGPRVMLTDCGAACSLRQGRALMP